MLRKFTLDISSCDGNVKLTELNNEALPATAGLIHRKTCSSVPMYSLIPDCLVSFPFNRDLRSLSHPIGLMKHTAQV